MFQREYDCVVMGGGPAGCTAAALLARAGVRTLLVEREAVPRFHVGESLMPETYWTLERLGVLPELERQGFYRKSGVQFVSDSGKESRPFFFREHDPRDCSQTWHVERAEFDRILFEQAARDGAECHDQTRVSQVDFDGQRATGVRLERDGQSYSVRARVVVDGTGQQSLIGRRLGLIEPNPRLRKAAIWSYFQDCEPQADGQGATVILHTSDKMSWFWFIPLRNGQVSVGLVADHERLLKAGKSPEEMFADAVAQCPGIARRLAPATQVDRHHVAKEFSYGTRQHAGDGWVLIGDAFGFIDPVYSSGVFLALKSGELAADAIVEGLANNDLSGEQLGRWCEPFKSGIHWVRGLVDAFYHQRFRFSDFMSRHPEHRGNLSDVLIGRVFHEEAGNMFDDLRRCLEMT